MKIYQINQKLFFTFTDTYYTLKDALTSQP